MSEIVWVVCPLAPAFNACSLKINDEIKTFETYLSDPLIVTRMLSLLFNELILLNC